MATNQSAVPPSGNGPLHPENIPAILCELPQWVCWRYEDRDGKRTKAPIDAKSNGRLTYAKSNDPATWAGFVEALTACGIHPELAGVGFCFAPGDGLTGIDLDHVIDPDTGELKPEATEIIARFAGTYIEVSPSGTGIRIFCKGTPRRSGKNTGKAKWLEVYAHPSSRYLTVTGHRWDGAAAEVTEQQAALDWLHGRFMESTERSSKTVDAKAGPADPLDMDDAALLDKARRARNGGDFERLWSGDTSAHGGDESAADLALCNHLAFYIGNDPARIDRLFRQSGLIRPKWDKVHYSDGRTYGQATIEKAMAGNRETYSGHRPGAGARHDQARPAMADSGQAGAGAIPDDDLFSDYGNVVKLLNRLSGRLAYSPGLDWLLYCPDTGVWEPEPCAERVKNLVLETLREAWGEVLDKAAVKSESIRKQRKELDDDDPGTATLDKRLKYAASDRAKVANWVRQCETAYRIRSTLEIAEGYFWTRPEVWDANPHILVCNNGVLDLATGTLLPHSPDYRATKTTGTDFIPGARHPAWDAVVALLQAEGDRYAFIHHYCGSGLHGENPNERAVIFQGDGGTGKGTLLTAIHRALGAYAETVEVGTLLATDWRKQNKSAPREDLLKLRGARFVYPSLEPPKDSKIDDASFKALVGNDAIAARYPHARNSITFRPVFKLVIQTNFPLRTEFNDPGMKRRVIVVPFNQKPERPDPTIKNALINDPTARAACLAWLYEGYRAWRANGFDLPVSTLAAEATAEYWREMDPYAQFAADVGLRFGKGLKCQKSRLNGVFKAWREESGRTDARHREFPRWLVSMGCWEGWDSNKNREWHGVEFLDLPPLPPLPPPEIGNKVVDFHTSKSIDEFPKTTRGNGGSGGKDQSPADALSSHHGDASKPVGGGNSANKANSGERKSCAASGYPPVDNLPAGAFSDARELWKVLQHVRGAETADRLAQKLGWSKPRVTAAAMELRTHGLATVNGPHIGPIQPLGAGAGQRDRGEI